ncbi:MAG TPA: hypothetical protein VHJ20_17220 [Polyangia bacterium]|nr:hypothetical protein [Polyangia bacterium]
MVDLPQHAAQISIWKHLHDPSFGFEPYFQLTYATPYLACYALARFFAEFTSVLVALELVVALTIVGLPLSLVPFFRRAGVSRWWSLLGFPLAYGFSFRWGFVTFMLGVPVLFLYLCVADDYARRPSARLGAALAVFTFALFWVHGLLLPFGAAIAGMTIARETPDVRTAARRAWPLFAPLPLVVAWVSSGERPFNLPNVWALGPHRLSHLFALYGYTRPNLSAIYVALVGVVVALRVRGSAWRGAWPLALTISIVLLWPFRAFGIGYGSMRFNVFLLPFVIAWLRPRAPRVLPAALVGLAVVVAAVVVARFRAFDADARDYDVVAASIPPRPRVRPLIFLPGDDDEFVHFPAWTQAEKGGLYGFTIVTSYTVARYKADAPRLMGTEGEYDPGAFDLAREASAHYDTFVVRADASDDEIARRVFKNAPQISLLASRGKWHVFRSSSP